MTNARSADDMISSCDLIHRSQACYGSRWPVMCVSNEDSCRFVTNHVSNLGEIIAAV